MLREYWTNDGERTSLLDFYTIRSKRKDFYLFKTKFWELHGKVYFQDKLIFRRCLYSTKNWTNWNQHPKMVEKKSDKSTMKQYVNRTGEWKTYFIDRSKAEFFNRNLFRIRQWWYKHFVHCFLQAANGLCTNNMFCLVSDDLLVFFDDFNVNRLISLMNSNTLHFRVEMKLFFSNFVFKDRLQKFANTALNIFVICR